MPEKSRRGEKVCAFAFPRHGASPHSVSVFSEAYRTHPLALPISLKSGYSCVLSRLSVKRQDLWRTSARVP